MKERDVMAKITKTTAKTVAVKGGKKVAESNTPKVEKTAEPKQPKEPKAPKQPKAPSEFEQRAELATKHSEKLVREWNERRGGRVRGVSTGLGVEAAWGYVFEKNMKAKVADRMTDTQIADWMTKEFPGKTGRDGQPTSSFGISNVQTVRTKFNRGAFGMKPEAESQPWNAETSTWEIVKRGRKPGTGAVRKAKDDGVPSAPGFGKKKLVKATA